MSDEKKSVSKTKPKGKKDWKKKDMKLSVLYLSINIIPKRRRPKNYILRPRVKIKWEIMRKKTLSSVFKMDLGGC